MNKEKKHIAVNIVIAILVITAAVFAILFIHRLYVYDRENEVYESIRNEYAGTLPDPADNNADSDTTYEIRTFDWDALLAQNSDLVGWIEMAPGIDYPIVQGETNQTYLHTDFYGNYAFSGCIFMNSDNAPNWTDSNTIIYGHNMMNGSMFGTLDYYYDRDYSMEHPNIYIYTPEGRFTYKIARDMIVTDGGVAYSYGLFTPEMMQEYINDSASEANVNYTLDPGIQETDRIITLSTCRSSSGSARHILQAVLDGFTDYEGNSYTKEEINAAMNELRNTVLIQEPVEA